MSSGPAAWVAAVMAIKEQRKRNGWRIEDGGEGTKNGSLGLRTWMVKQTTKKAARVHRAASNFVALSGVG
jgi:hypothetical protein